MAYVLMVACQSIMESTCPALPLLFAVVMIFTSLVIDQRLGRAIAEAVGSGLQLCRYLCLCTEAAGQFDAWRDCLPCISMYEVASRSNGSV
jgi:hypothetical protein